ncbi:thyroglobulin-like [Euwallacea similis]|uniref:thyroglobulin-like n=1 Tax=Euwallacea similis TaxID=1736056 RepID=UPI00344DA5D5
MSKKTILWFFFIVTCIKTNQLLGDEDVRCISSSCSDAECSSVPSKCNSSIPSSGVYMLSPDICNCCEYCLANIEEGEPCSIGDPSNAKHTSICGPGLTCFTTDGNTDGKCQKMSEGCVGEQTIYDQRRANGFLGSMEVRPTCDDDGNYSPYKCIPGQTCHCVLSDSTRVFGDADYSSIADYMTCACARGYQGAVDILGRELGPHEHFRCAADGSFDRLQCINNQCLCVDAADGAPTFPDAKLVNLTDISNETLPCYTDSVKGNYYRKCEAEFMEIYKEVAQKKNESHYSLVIGYNYPQCDLDGTYAPSQESKTHKYCVSKDGDLLTEPLLKSDSNQAELVSSMDCKCVRAAMLMTSMEKPSCLKNGNYDPVQCRRGVCRCVDPNGNQQCSAEGQCEEKDESDKDNLHCS